MSADSASCDRVNLPDIDLLVFDFDGVLTDNRVLVLEDGREAVICNRSDGLAFDTFRARGLPVLIMSTEKNRVVSARAEKLKVQVLQAIADKGQAIDEYCQELGIDIKRVIYVGNDLNDLPAMRRVGFPVAVADAHPTVKAIAWRVLSKPGGGGAARALAEEVLECM